MLVLITVVALVPLGVGLGVSQLVGRGSASSTARPPVVTVTSGGGSVRVAPSSFDWAVGDRHPAAVRAGGPRVAADEAVVRVAPGGSLTLAWSIRGAPSSLAVALDSPGSPTQPLTPGNPVQVRMREPPGTYAIAVATTWSQGQAGYYFRVEVT